MNHRLPLLMAIAISTCSCANRQFTQGAAALDTLVVDVKEVDRPGWDYEPMATYEGGAFLWFIFKSSSSIEVKAMINQGSPLQRPVHIVAGENVIARATLIGPARWVDLDGQVRWGLTVRTESVSQAREAAWQMREDPWDALARQIEDPRAWIISPSAGTQQSAAVSTRSEMPTGLQSIRP